MGRVVYVDKIPDCDLCAKDNKVVPAIVDAKTVAGGWANMCPEHRRRWSVGGPKSAGEHPLENPYALRKPEPPKAAPGTVGAVLEARARDDFIREKLKEPPMDRIQQMVFDEIPCEALDGCIVEPDGQCEHGYPSWPVALGII